MIKMSWTMDRIQYLKDRAKESGYEISPDQDLVEEVNSPHGLMILQMINEHIRYKIFSVFWGKKNE